jgi:hypothetical protein
MVEGDDPDAMVAIAILVSRVEALCLASMLEAAGVHVVIGGDRHASVEVISLALGHRIWVPASQAAVASAVIRESKHIEGWRPSIGLRWAVLRFVSGYTALCGAMFAWGITIGAFPLVILLSLLLVPFTVPVNPQGRGDYYLTEAEP